MKKIFSEKNKFNNYLQVELAIVSYLHYNGIVSEKEFKAINEKATFSLKNIRENEKIYKHDVIAFTREVTSHLGDEKKWIHYGLTSSDVVDTGLAISYKEANEVLIKDLKKFKKALVDKAIEYKNTPCIGRTHGMHAEVTSFGLKWALYYDELTRDIERFKLAKSQIEVGMISGAVGTFTYLPPECQDYVCDRLGLSSSKISNQILPRDSHAFYVEVIALIGGLLEKIADEIRNLQRTEIGEVQECFSIGQKGSSAMPHKHNPIGSENIVGCSRLLRGYTTAMLEDIALFHERDISHSSVERVALIDAITLLDYMLQRMSKIIETLIVDTKRMKDNIFFTHEVIFSERVLTSLVEKGLSREKAYDLVQPLAQKAYDEGTSFLKIIRNDGVLGPYFQKEELESFKDLSFYLKNVDQIYERVGL
jgi:adenylosuccinate lyase